MVCIYFCYIFALTNYKQINTLNIMSELQSLKKLNSLKQIAINNGGYEKHKTIILTACELHKEKFGKDYTPKHLK